MKVYCYSKCSTCRQLIRLLDEKKIKYEYIELSEMKDFNEDFVRDIFNRSGGNITKIFNTSGKVYREKKLRNVITNISEDEALKLINSFAVIRRPIIDTGSKVYIGPGAKKYVMSL